MAEKNMNSRIQHKHDVEENWLKAGGFSPKDGELIIYDADTLHPFPRLKIGDGETNVNNLPFQLDPITVDDIDEICGASLTTTVNTCSVTLAYDTSGRSEPYITNAVAYCYSPEQGYYEQTLANWDVGVTISNVVCGSTLTAQGTHTNYISSVQYGTIISEGSSANNYTYAIYVGAVAGGTMTVYGACSEE